MIREIYIDIGYLIDFLIIIGSIFLLLKLYHFVVHIYYKKIILPKLETELYNLYREFSINRTVDSFENLRISVKNRSKELYSLFNLKNYPFTIGEYTYDFSTKIVIYKKIFLARFYFETEYIYYDEVQIQIDNRKRNISKL